MVTVHTTRGPYPIARVDVSRAGNGPFSPSWALIQDVLTVSDGKGPCLPVSRFVERYKAELRTLWRRRGIEWTRLAALGREHGFVVLTCVCKAPEQCVRGVLANILVATGPRLRTEFVRGRELAIKSYGHVTMARRDEHGRRCVPLIEWEKI